MRKKEKSEKVSCMRLDSLLIIHVLCQSHVFLGGIVRGVKCGEGDCGSQ